MFITFHEHLCVLILYRKPSLKASFTLEPYTGLEISTFKIKQNNDSNKKNDNEKENSSGQEDESTKASKGEEEIGMHKLNKHISLIPFYTEDNPGATNGINIKEPMDETMYQILQTLADN